ncbi:NUDIX domain-containing protein [Candidatus Pacearchaeota archaeon]|nr:NUDIX domain-containing protein [Candidatus Pacearchaeota archaeon]
MEKTILKEFLYNNKLKFSDIEKSIKVRSNKLAYHIKNLIKKGVLKKQGDEYQLSETAEELIPYISDKQSPIPVILIAITKNSNQFFLHTRKKRPFKNKLSLPGGRILSNESLDEAVKRIMKQKHFIDAKLQNINSISLEHVKKQDKKIHSFLLVFATASTKDKIEYTNISKDKSKIISSDYSLIKKDIKKQIEVKEFLTID